MSGMSIPSSQTLLDVAFRQPQVTDGAQIWSLVRKTGVLDLNSEYCYLMLSAYFRETCIVAEQSNKVVGYVSAFRMPSRPEVLFIWQVAVDERLRGHGMGTTMLSELLQSDACRNVRSIETTVSPSNTSSSAMFRKFARRVHAQISITEGFPNHLFASKTHEDEKLWRIGPLRRVPRSVH